MACKLIILLVGVLTVGLMLQFLCHLDDYRGCRHPGMRQARALMRHYPVLLLPMKSIVFEPPKWTNKDTHSSMHSIQWDILVVNCFTPHQRCSKPKRLCAHRERKQCNAFSPSHVEPMRKQHYSNPSPRHRFTPTRAVVTEANL